MLIIIYGKLRLKANSVFFHSTKPQSRSAKPWEACDSRRNFRKDGRTSHIFLFLKHSSRYKRLKLKLLFWGHQFLSGHEEMSYSHFKLELYTLSWAPSQWHNLERRAVGLARCRVAGKKGETERKQREGQRPREGEKVGMRQKCAQLKLFEWWQKKTAKTWTFSTAPGELTLPMSRIGKCFIVQISGSWRPTWSLC